MKTNKVANYTHALITPDHLKRKSAVYCRASAKRQIRTGQLTLIAVARSYGWPHSRIEIIDDDLATPGSSSGQRSGWLRLQVMIDADMVGAVFVTTISRLARKIHEVE